jgi:hypothetical protein
VSWLLPGFLAGTALIGLPLLLHFLRRKPKTTVLFPSLRFLGETAIHDTRRHRIQRWLTLLLRCLVIGALATAFARPFWKDSASARRTAMVIAIDNSMSMQTRGRWEAWRASALEQLDALGPGDQAAVLQMFPRPIWLAPMTDDLERVRAAVENARPGYEKTRYAPALRIAADTLAATPAADRFLVWMADEQRAGWLGADLAQPLPAGIQLRLGETAPEPRRQAALTKLAARPDGRLVATVCLFQPGHDLRELTVSDGRTVLWKQLVDLRAGDNTIEIALPKAAGDAKFLRGSLDPDDLPADDTAWMLSGSDRAGDAVFLDAAPEPDFLALALRATQKLDAGALEPKPLPEGAWPAKSVVILRDGASFRAPRVAELDQFLDRGGSVWIFLDGSPEQLAWLGKQGIKAAPRMSADAPWRLRDWDAEHPVLAAYAGQSLLPLLDVEFSLGFDLSGPALAPLASWPDGATALAEWSEGGRHVLLAGFPLTREATNWPAQPSFVPFVHQAARWLGAFADARRDWRVGDAISLPEGAGTWRALDGPSAGESRPAQGSVRAETPGVYEFATATEGALFTVNVPTEESDLAPWPKPAQLLGLQGAAVPEADSAVALPPATPLSEETTENQQRLWWWLLAICGVALIAELALANRTAL